MRIVMKTHNNCGCPAQGKKKVEEVAYPLKFCALHKRELDAWSRGAKGGEDHVRNRVADAIVDLKQVLDIK